jgi:hypothetical protein
MMLMDSEREKAVGIGRDWNLPPLNKGEMYITKRMAEVLNVNKGGMVLLG